MARCDYCPSTRTVTTANGRHGCPDHLDDLMRDVTAPIRAALSEIDQRRHDQSVFATEAMDDLLHFEDERGITG
jgi:hypothetical protein